MLSILLTEYFKTKCFSCFLPFHRFFFLNAFFFSLHYICIWIECVICCCSSWNSECLSYLFLYVRLLLSVCSHISKQLIHKNLLSSQKAIKWTTNNECLNYSTQLFGWSKFGVVFTSEICVRVYVHCCHPFHFRTINQHNLQIEVPNFVFTYWSVKLTTILLNVYENHSPAICCNCNI